MEWCAERGHSYIWQRPKGVSVLFILEVVEGSTSSTRRLTPRMNPPTRARTTGLCPDIECNFCKACLETPTGCRHCTPRIMSSAPPFTRHHGAPIYMKWAGMARKRVAGRDRDRDEDTWETQRGGCICRRSPDSSETELPRLLPFAGSPKPWSIRAALGTSWSGSVCYKPLLREGSGHHTASPDQSSELRRGLCCLYRKPWHHTNKQRMCPAASVLHSLSACPSAGSRCS